MNTFILEQKDGEIESEVVCVRETERERKRKKHFKTQLT